MLTRSLSHTLVSLAAAAGAGFLRQWASKAVEDRELNTVGRGTCHLLCIKKTHVGFF